MAANSASAAEFAARIALNVSHRPAFGNMKPMYSRLLSRPAATAVRYRWAFKMRDSVFVLLATTFLLLTCIGCQNNPAADPAIDAELERQNERYEQQLDKADDQIERIDSVYDKVEENGKRLSRLLDRQEKQADRYDKILDKLENQSPPQQ